MNIVLSNHSDTPFYQQIYDQISRQIISGDLPKDFCLPSIRMIASELRISVITIKRAWEELEKDGFIYTQAGKGCFVRPISAQKLTEKVNSIASEKMKKDLEYYKGLGLSLPEILDLVNESF